MLSYCLRYRKNAENKNPKIGRTKNGRIMLSSKSKVSAMKKSKLIKN